MGVFFTGSQMATAGRINAGNSAFNYNEAMLASANGATGNETFGQRAAQSQQDILFGMEQSKQWINYEVQSAMEERRKKRASEEIRSTFSTFA